MTNDRKLEVILHVSHMKYHKKLESQVIYALFSNQNSLYTQLFK